MRKILPTTSELRLSGTDNGTLYRAGIATSVGMLCPTQDQTCRLSNCTEVRCYAFLLVRAGRDRHAVRRLWRANRSGQRVPKRGHQQECNNWCGQRLSPYFMG